MQQTVDFESKRYQQAAAIREKHKVSLSFKPCDVYSVLFVFCFLLFLFCFLFVFCCFFLGGCFLGLFVFCLFLFF